jgi:hypothetical protein
VSTAPEGTGTPPPGSGSGSQSLQGIGRKVNEESQRRSPFMFAVIGLCFFLPFISISCSGQRLATLSGVQLVTGADITVDADELTQELGDAFGAPADEDAPPETQENDPSVWAIIALAAAVLGVVVGFVTKGRTRAIASLTAAVLGLGGLIGLRFDLEGDLSEAEGLVTVDYRIGYWIAALLFLVLAIAHGSLVRAERNRSP